MSERAREEGPGGLGLRVDEYMSTGKRLHIFTGIGGLEEPTSG